MNRRFSKGRNGLWKIDYPNPEPPVTKLFFSDWSFATGTGLTAKNDNGKWTTVLDSQNGLNVVAVTTEGLPTANYLEITAKELNAGTQRLAVTGLGTLADGASRWVRCYMRCDEPYFGVLADNSQHPVESGQTGGFAWVINTVLDADDGQWWLNFQATGVTLFWQQHWRCPKLTKGVWYRVELQVEKITGNSFLYHGRVYDINDTLLYSDADFINANGSDGVSAGQYSFSDAVTLTAGNLTQIDEARAGLNGITGSEWYPEILYGAQAGYAISDEGWCGAYTTTYK